METITIKFDEQDESLRKLLDEMLSRGAELVRKTTTRTKKSPYNPEFVKMILAEEQAVKEGRGARIKREDLWK